MEAHPITGPSGVAVPTKSGDVAAPWGHLVCPDCQSSLSPKDEALSCNGCQTFFPVTDGIPCMAPVGPDEVEDYDPNFFDQLAEVEAGNFWFEHRNRLVATAIGRYHGATGRYLEVGCGTGFVLNGVGEQCPELELWGSELHTDGLRIARSRRPEVNFIQLDARRLPFRNAFDVIGMYDVLEHIEEDSTVIAELHRALHPGGHVIFTVPQHQWLWSEVDALSGHKRRYRPKELPQKLTTAGFEVLEATSFVSLLAPVMWAARRLGGQPAQNMEDVMRQFYIHPWLNASFAALLGVEHAITSHTPVRFPVGSSQLVVARRPL